MRPCSIVKETGAEEVDIQLKVHLENGVTLYVDRCGGALGTDGRMYYPVMKEVAEQYHGHPDVVAEVVGWSSDLSQERVIPLEQ